MDQAKNHHLPKARQAWSCTSTDALRERVLSAALELVSGLAWAEIDYSSSYLDIPANCSVSLRDRDNDEAPK